MNTEKDLENKQNIPCVCKTNAGLFIPNRKLSLITAGFLLIAFLTFMTGYFVGQHSAVESFSSKIENESFADQIYASLFGPGEYRTSKEISEQEAEQAVQKEEVLEESEEKNDIDNQVAIASDIENGDNNEESISLLPQESYYAQLIGFGTERAAQKFAERLAAKDISVEVKKRQSKTAKGKIVSWYQVVTQAYNDKEKLRVLVDRIEKTEKIKGAQIVSC